MIRYELMAALVLALIAAPAGAQDQARTLEPGDALRLEVWRQPELTGEFMIAEDGGIMHPLFRGISVAGVDFETVRERVAGVLSQYESQPRFVIQPLLRVSVGGEVRQPSLYRLPPTTTIGEAIAQAGGLSDRGDLEDVLLFREGREIRVDLTQASAGLAQEPIWSGDQIFVQRRTSIFRDYIAPAGGLFAAAATIVNIIISNN